MLVEHLHVRAMSTHTECLSTAANVGQGHCIEGDLCLLDCAYLQCKALISKSDLCLLTDQACVPAKYASNSLSVAFMQMWVTMLHVQLVLLVLASHFLTMNVVTTLIDLYRRHARWGR